MAGDYLFVTSVPSFYKNLLFKAIYHKVNISVFYSYRSPVKRHRDFFKYLDQAFVLCDKKEKGIQKGFKLLSAARKSRYVYYGGWDDPYYWLALFLTPRRKNIIMVESNIYDLRESGLGQKMFNLAKRFYLNRAACCMVSGTPHGQLVRKLGFRGSVKYLYGVGLLDFEYPPVQKSSRGDGEVKNFLFIGRISQIKGIDILLREFQKHPELTLHLVGEQEDDFMLENQGNVTVHGYIKRTELADIFAACDVFILPSLSEPWGLVVEEALYHGLPAIVSSRVGCGVDVVERNDVGLIFNIDKPESLGAAIRDICKPDTYNNFVANTYKIDFNAARNHYVDTILSATS